MWVLNRGRNSLINQPLPSDHAFIKQWAVLEKIGEDDKQAGSVGYLQLDLSIVVPSEPPAPAMLQTYDDDIVEA